MSLKMFRQSWLWFLLLLIPGHCADNCPQKCRCSKNYQKVDCQNKKLQHIPDDIPSNVTDLRLGNNLLTGLPAYAFGTLRELSYLSLNHNLLVSQNIHKDAFRGLANLKFLHVTMNSITNVSSELFKDLISLERIYFSQNKMSDIPDLGNCRRLSKFGIDNNKLEVARFPEGFKNLSDLSSIILSNNPINNFTYGDVASLVYSNIHKIDLARCQLNYVDVKAFTAFPQLQSLSIAYNINPIGLASVRNIINGLSDSPLSSLDLSGSLHIDGEFPPDLFSSFSAVPLRTLNLAHMTGANTIQNGTFTNLVELIYLDLSFCGLDIINSGAFNKYNMKLQQLNLAWNVLKKIPSNLPVSLKYLNLMQNHGIDTVGELQFAGLSALEKIDFAFCAIRTISTSAFSGAINLVSLNFTGNAIAGSDIGVGVFSNLINLKYLSLKRNKMTRIMTENNLFKDLTKLEILDMSENKCSFLPQGIFYPLESLRILDLSTNNISEQLSTEPGEMFSHLGKLVFLNLEKNGLSVLSKSSFQGLENLKYLMLAHNSISHWDEYLFNKTQLIVLDFSNNEIAIVNETSVLGLSRNALLNLSSNPFDCWCDLIWFRNWMDELSNKTGVQLVANDSYTCNSPDSMAGKKVWEFHTQAIHQQCFPPPWIYIVIGASAGAAGLIIFGVTVIYRYRWPIRLHIYKLGKRMRGAGTAQRSGYENIPGEDEMYDVVISYGPGMNDRKWVTEVLVPNLDCEKNGRWKTFYEARDVGPNASAIGEISESMWMTRKVILVISKDYLDDSRRDFEVKLALSSLEERQLNMMDAIIVVILDDEMSVRMPQLLHPFMRENEQLNWTDDSEDGKEYFWRKLNEKIELDSDYPSVGIQA